ncbi:hypothetical protein ACQKWADRAFT_299840 [Trichoderma austrokoningii]
MERTTASRAVGFGDRRTGNLRRSCEACRSSKVRCILDMDNTNVPQICKRCSSNGTACIFEHAIARPRRARPTPKSRSKAVEEKIEGLVTLISSISEKGESNKELRSSGSTEQVSAALLPDVYQDVFSKGFLATDEANQLLASFTATSAEFPLIILPFQADLEYLRWKRPCLLLGILTACARDHLQTKLEAEFRKTLADRVILNVEKSLDLLQGLLVFLTWNHLYFHSAREQIYQLSQLAITMAVELRLGPPDESLKGILIQHRETSEWSSHSESYHSIVENMRTFVACYYISSCIALSMRKPTHFKYSNSIAECCRLLKCVSQTASEEILPCFVQLQKLAEEIDGIFHYSNREALQSMDSVQINATMKNFRWKIDQLVQHFSPQAKANSLIQRKILYLQVYMQEVGLHAPIKHQDLHDLGNFACCNWCSSLQRFNIVISCVQAAQKYIKEYVFLPQKNLQNTVLFQESELLYAILVLAAGTLGGIAVGEPGQLRDCADISTHLTALKDKMQTIGSITENGQDRRDYFWKMMQFFKHCLNWNSANTESQSHATSNCLCSIDNNMSFTTILENVPEEEVIQDNEMFNILDMSWIIDISEL